MFYDVPFLQHCTSIRSLCRASSGTSTRSISGASNWASSWLRPLNLNLIPARKSCLTTARQTASSISSRAIGSKHVNHKIIHSLRSIWDVLPKFYNKNYQSCFWHNIFKYMNTITYYIVKFACLLKLYVQHLFANWQKSHYR